MGTIRGRRTRRAMSAAAAISAAVVLAAACSGSGTVGKAAATKTSTTSTSTGTPSASASTPDTPGTSTPSSPSSPTSSANLSAADYAAGKSNPAADDVYPQYGDTATDVLHYGLDLKWDPAARNLTGTATLTIRAAKPTGHFLLDLAEGMTADSTTVDGAAANAVHAGEHLTVPLGGQRPADATATVVIAYHGTPAWVKPPTTRPDIQGLGAAVTAGGAVWAQQEPYGAFTWYPCNDQPSDKALYDVTITAPDGWAGVSGGTFAGRTEQNGSGVYKWHQGDPVASYLVAFAVDRFKEGTATGPHGLPITYWYLPSQEAVVQPLMAKMPEMISFLEQRFGPYPFPTAGVLFRPEMVGMETQTMITLTPSLPEDDLLHELAHQWFGDAVTPTTWSGLWLNEGFAMYAQFMWDVAKGQGGANGMTLDQYMMARVQPRDQMLRSSDGPPGHYLPTHFASTNVYYCPALMLNGLHDALGDKAFFQLLNDWAHKNKGTNQDRTAFIAFVKAETGKDFSAYINAWLDSPTTPTIKPDGTGGAVV